MVNIRLPLLKMGYTFNPANQAVTIGGSDVSGINFTQLWRR